MDKIPDSAWAKNPGREWAEYKDNYDIWLSLNQQEYEHIFL